MPSGQNSKTRIVIAFLFLVIVLSVGAYYVGDLAKLQERMAARDGRPASPVMAMATRAVNETNAAIEKLSNEIEQPAIAINSHLGEASLSELEALRRDLKTAEANATTFMPRYIAVLKTERDKVEQSARALGAADDATGKLLENIDKRDAEMTAFIAQMLPARVDFYRAYQTYVAFLVAEFGTYKVVNGQIIFPQQRTVDRYNAAANAMSVAAKRVADLEETRKTLLKSQQEKWRQFVIGK